MDTFILNAITQELAARICPSKINNILQPDEFTLIFVLWTQGHEQRLAISVDSRYQYCFLTQQKPDSQTLAFAKFLLCHIKGGEILRISKPPLERIVTFDIARRDIDGQPLRFQLILEIMGRYSNLILVQQESGKILDSARHVTAEQSSFRRLAPGAVYVPPPTQDKIALTNISRQQFERILSERAAAPLWKMLIEHIQGVSPLIAKEIAGSDSDEDAARWARLDRIAESVRNGEYQPTLVLEEHERGDAVPVLLSALLLEQFSREPNRVIRAFDSMSAAAETYYQQVAGRQQFDSLKTSLLSAIAHRAAKIQKKREHLAANQREIEQADDYRIKGEMLTANMHRVRKGLTSVALPNYYADDQAEIDIPLDPKFSPAQNAQRYFKQYNKLKQGKEVTAQRLLEAEQMLAYLDELAFFVESAENIEALRELRGDIQDTKPAEHSRQQKKKQEEPPQPFRRFVSSDGFQIYVGKNSRENDLLTLRTAQPDDIWLHAYNAPGSHALILNRERKAVPERTIAEAAALAAYYSKLRRAGKADVMFTFRKYVRKPKGTPPGLVTVSEFETIRVVPRAIIG
ncbi:fubronectin-binding A domain protein [Candidatus Moduliflexus flocculans]|uniref:Rqc2 homolog RqcH n=1 Tax=Candidatus Moduliflexus flocculans TaxID=1499966 RepID=A0A0S6VT24_9BACT|nr:fubronectin-binding A domain protein [Candidatus Moduliflexus flocculans]